MTALPVFQRRPIKDENFDPCRKCPTRQEWHDGLRCKRVKIARYDKEGSIADELDPVELLVVADPPTKQDEEAGGFWKDKDGRELLKAIKASGAESFAIVPAVRCYPGEQVDHFILQKKYRTERKNSAPTALDTAMDAVEHCKEYVVRARSTFRPKRTLAFGPLASKALSDDRKKNKNSGNYGVNTMALRAQPIHPNPGLRAASVNEGTIFTWDRAYARVSKWAANELFFDVDEKLPNIRETSFATPRGDHTTIKQVTLDTVGKVRKFVKYCLTSKDFKKSDFLGFDFETDNLEHNRENNRILNVGFAFRHAENKSFIIPLEHPETPFSAEELKVVFKLLRKLFKGKGAKWYAFLAHNAQFETAMVKLFFDVWIGDEGNKPILDSLLLAYLLDENRHKKGIKNPYGLETLALEKLGFRWYTETGIKTRRDRLAAEPIAKVNEYVGMDAAVTVRLVNWILEQMEEEGSISQLLRVASKLYSEAIHYTVDMRLTGQVIDIDLLRLLRGPKSSIGPRLAEIRKTFNEDPRCKKALKIVNRNKMKGKTGGPAIFKTSATAAATKFDLNSDLHRKALFWDVMKLKGAKESVDKKFQEKYAEREPLVALFQEYQSLSKLDSAYLTPIAEYLQSAGDGRLHPSFNLTKTTSGRLSASEPNCYDKETEILTRRGWVFLPELTDQDEVAQWHWEDDRIDFVVPTEVSTLEYTSDLVSIQNDHIDLVVTPNHRCPVIRPKDWEVREFVASSYPGGSKKYRQWQASRWQGGNVSLTEAEVALICAAQADGSWRSDVKQGAMEWTFHKQRKIDRLRWALDQTGGTFTDRPKGEKGTRIYASRSAALDFIEAAIGPEKVFKPEWILSLDRETLDRFVAEVNFWDGCHTRNNQYTSTIERNADSVQIALVLSGIRATVNERKGHDAWTIHQTDARPYSWTTNIEPKRVRSSGEVYCVTVPTGYVMVRRNGKVSICGQTQQVPRGDTRDKKQIKSLYTVPADKIMVQLDFSQAEVRWLGILSGDENLARRYQVAKELKDALRANPDDPELQKKVKIDGDLHMSTALDMYKLDRDLPFTDPATAKLKRQNAKAVCFGLIYGKHYKSLARDLGISDEEAEEAVEKWMGQFPWAAAWLEEVDNTIGDTCVSISPFGRWRRLAEAAATDRSVQNRAKRQARNTPIQSAASDFCIYAACKLRRAIRNHPDPRIREGVSLINTVHDSLGAEVPADQEVVMEYMRMGQEIFTDPNLIKKDFGIVTTVPLEVDFDVGLNWGNVVGCEPNEKDVEQVMFDVEVLRRQPSGTLLSDLKGKGLLYEEVQAQVL